MQESAVRRIFNRTATIIFISGSVRGIQAILAGEIEAERIHLTAYTDARLARLEVEALLQGHLARPSTLNAGSQPRPSLNNSHPQGH